MELFQKKKRKHQRFITKVTIKKNKSIYFYLELLQEVFSPPSFVLPISLAHSTYFTRRATNGLRLPYNIMPGILPHSSPLLPRASTFHSCSFAINISVRTPWFLKNSRSLWYKPEIFVLQRKFNNPINYFHLMSRTLHISLLNDKTF